MAGFHHCLFGLHVRSNRELPFAPAVPAGEGDVVCTIGEPFEVRDAQALDLDRDVAPYTLARADETYALEYADGTRFRVTRDSIAMTWREPLTFEDAYTYFPGAPFALLLRLRGLACLHASAVTLDGRTTAFVGPSGAGKSTRAAMMLARGATLVAEDVLAIARIDGEIVALPGYAGIRLWPEAVEIVAGARDALPLISRTWEKRILVADRFAAEPVRIDAIERLAPGAWRPGEERRSDSGAMHQAPGALLLDLIANSYRPEMLDARMRQNEFEIFTELACSTSSATAR